MKDNTWLTNKYIAHRGLFDNVTVPENSLPAFEKAIENNFAIETDVQMTADGVLVIFHDDDMERMTGIKGDIREKNFDEVQTARLIGTDCHIPTFAEFLAKIGGRAPLLIEIKTHKNVGIAEEKILEELKDYNGEYVFESFNPLIIRWLKLHAPNVPRGQLAFDFKGAPLPAYQRFLLRNLSLCKWNGTQFLAYGEMSIVGNKKVAKYRKKMPVVCWTITSQEQHERLKKYYDNIIFDSFMPRRDDLNETNKEAE